MVTREVPVVPFLTPLVLMTCPLRRNCSISASRQWRLDRRRSGALGPVPRVDRTTRSGLAVRQHIPPRITRASAGTRRLINTSACILRPDTCDGARRPADGPPDARHGVVVSVGSDFMATPTTPECWLRGPIADVQPALHAGGARLSADARGRRKDGGRPDRRTALDVARRRLVGRFSFAPPCRQHRSTADLRQGRDAERCAESGIQGGIGNPVRRCDGTAVRCQDGRSSRPWRSCARRRRTTLLEARAVGRARLPTTVLGLLFHAAEHSQRHAGQVVTTAKIVRGSDVIDCAVSITRITALPGHCWQWTTPSIRA